MRNPGYRLILRAQSILLRASKSFLSLLLVLMLQGDCWDDGPAGSASSSATSSSSSLRPWIDTHTHPTGIDTDCFSESCVNASILAMDAAGLKKAIFINPPAPYNNSSSAKEAGVRTAAYYRTDRLFYGIGGSMLQARIDTMPDSGVATEAQKSEFESTFNDLISSGPAAVVVGETASLHLSYSANHAFEENPANSDLFLLLADLAASHDIAIDVHIDVVTQTMQTPSFYVTRSPNNPSTLQPNIPDFEELLDHNLNARIVLAHVGRDTTGVMNSSLMDGLLARHSNLYAQIAPQVGPADAGDGIVDRTGKVRSDWLTLLQKYPTRFVLGSDIFWDGGTTSSLLQGVQDFLQQLPSDIAYQIGCTNPVAIYKLSSGC
ncbi:MAG: hypothetical protein HY547_10020 [Elusimicrobia bacterium]|nr:hypothetical protein [Elusimicrobiota bacterium]